MKLLCCLLAICVTANANPAPPPTREQLKNLVDLLLSSIKDAPEEFAKFFDYAKDQVNQNLQTTTAAAGVKKTLNEKLAKITPGDEKFLNCIVSVERQYNVLRDTITNDLVAKLLKEKYHLRGDYLSMLQKELSGLKNVLENNADEEIDSCVDGKSKCELNTDYLTKGQEYLSFQSGMKDKIKLGLRESVEYFHLPETDKIIDNFVKTSNECLNA